MSILYKMSLSRIYNTYSRCITTISKPQTTSNGQFEHVFAFPKVGYFALLNRLKIYHFFGSCVLIPSIGILELLNLASESSFFLSSYIGITGGVVLSAVTLPFRNIIGHIYISEDNELIKISSIDYFGRRIDRIVKTEDWIPILEIKPKLIDAIYLRPQLKDGTKYKLLIRFGIVKNAKKVGQVLE